jgi:hypothetical protein
MDTQAGSPRPFDRQNCKLRPEDGSEAETACDTQANSPMPPSTPSLMDNMEFAAGIEKLELKAPRTGFPLSHSAHSGWDDLDEGLVADVVSDDSESAEWTPERATSADRSVFGERAAPATPAPNRSSVGRTVLLAAGLLVLVGVGAGAAALVFRDRLALILH